MRMRPVDASGDILPVLSAADLVTGADAVAVLVGDRLRLLTGDWWENPEWGCEILELIRDSRLTEKDAQAISTYLASYVRETPDVQDVRDEAWEFAGNQLRWSCTVITAYGNAHIDYISNY